MRNKTMRRGLAWILSAATIMTSVPVSAEEIVLDTNVVSEDEAAAEEQKAEDSEGASGGNGTGEQSGAVNVSNSSGLDLEAEQTARDTKAPTA